MSQIRPDWFDLNVESGMDVITSVALEGVNRLVLEPTEDQHRIMMELLSLGIARKTALKIEDFVSGRMVDSVLVGIKLGASLATIPMGLGSFEEWLAEGISKAGLDGFEVSSKLRVTPQGEPIEEQTA